MNQDTVIERLIDSLVSGQRIGRITLAQQLDGADDIISVSEAISLCEASIHDLLALQLRVRARAVIKAKELLDTPRGQDLVSEHMQEDTDDLLDEQERNYNADIAASLSRVMR